MWRESFQKWDGRGVFLLRLDYGYRASDAGVGDLDRGAYDLDRLPLARMEEVLHGPPGRAGVRVLKGADRLACLGKRRGGSEVWGALARASESEGLLLVGRFPRVTDSLGRILRENGLWAGGAENEVRGELPPLYAALPVDSPLFSLHLAYEWETGLARARATTVLAEAGALMALRGIVSPGQLAVGLSSTAGAARSYLNWMVEAGLARRAAAGFALRHPALGALFDEAIGEECGAASDPPVPPSALAAQREPPFPPSSGAAPAPQAEALPAPPLAPRWDPSELD